MDKKCNSKKKVRNMLELVEN